MPSPAPCSTPPKTSTVTDASDSAIELLSSIVNQSQLKIKKTFDEAVSLQPSIVIIDDLDCITASKDSNGKDTEKKTVFQLSNCLDAIRQVRHLSLLASSLRRLYVVQT